MLNYWTSLALSYILDHYARKHKYPIRRSALLTMIIKCQPGQISPRKGMVDPSLQSRWKISKNSCYLDGFSTSIISFILFVFPSFTLHTGYGPEFKSHCTTRWLVLESGSLGQLLSVITFPVYIWLTFSFLRQCIPKIFNHLFLGGSLLLLGLLSIFGTDLLGHPVKHQWPKNSSILAMWMEHQATVYMFKIDATKRHVKTLRLHWGFHIIPNLFIWFQLQPLPLSSYLPKALTLWKASWLVCSLLSEDSFSSPVPSFSFPSLYLTLENLEMTQEYLIVTLAINFAHCLCTSNTRTYLSGSQTISI